MIESILLENSLMCVQLHFRNFIHGEFLGGIPKVKYLFLLHSLFERCSLGEDIILAITSLTTTIESHRKLNHQSTSC